MRKIFAASAVALILASLVATVAFADYQGPPGLEGKENPAADRTTESKPNGWYKGSKSWAVEP